MVRALLLVILLVLPGIVGSAIFGYFALIDWDALQKAYFQFDTIAQSNANFPAIFVAEARQNIHRMNLFAEGVWMLLSTILAAIGIHGLCTTSRKRKKTVRKNGPASIS